MSVYRVRDRVRFAPFKGSESDDNKPIRLRSQAAALPGRERGGAVLPSSLLSVVDQNRVQRLLLVLQLPPSQDEDGVLRLAEAKQEAGGWDRGHPQPVGTHRVVLASEGVRRVVSERATASMHAAKSPAVVWGRISSAINTVLAHWWESTGSGVQ